MIQIRINGQAVGVAELVALGLVLAAIALVLIKPKSA